jgi:putative transport protein
MQAGPVFIEAARQLGIWIFLAGAAVTMTALLTALMFGRFVLKMNPILLIGAISGAKTYTGGLAAIQEKSGSRIAVLGYTVPYATSNVLLTMFGTVIVALVASH